MTDRTRPTDEQLITNNIHGDKWTMLFGDMSAYVAKASPHLNIRNIQAYLSSLGLRLFETCLLGKLTVVRISGVFIFSLSLCLSLTDSFWHIHPSLVGQKTMFVFYVGCI